MSTFLSHPSLRAGLAATLLGLAALGTAHAVPTEADVIGTYSLTGLSSVQALMSGVSHAQLALSGSAKINADHTFVISWSGTGHSWPFEGTTGAPEAATSSVRFSGTWSLSDKTLTLRSKSDGTLKVQPSTNGQVIPVRAVYEMNGGVYTNAFTLTR